MAAGLVGTGLLLLLLGGAVSPGIAREPKTTFERYLFAGNEARRAGRLVDAEKLLLAALAEAKKSPADAPRLGTVLGNLAGLYSQRGEEAKAVAFSEQALAADEEVFGPVHPRVANDLSNLAVFYEADRRDAEAEKCMKRAVEIQEQAPEIPVFERITILGNFAEFCIQRRRLAESEALLEREIEILESSPNPNYARNLAEARRRLADVYAQEGREREAEWLQNDAYKGVQPGGDTPLNSILTTLEQADDSCRDGKLVAAEASYREVIAGMENKPGFRNASILIRALEGLGRVCADSERDAEAEDFFQRAIALREQYASPEAPWMARSLGTGISLFALYREQGRLSEMEPVYERALAVQEKVLGPEDIAVANTSLRFADLYVEEEKYQEALPLYARAAKIQETNLGPSSRLAYTLGKYAHLLQQLGEENDAAAVRARAEAVLKRITAKNP